VCRHAALLVEEDAALLVDPPQQAPALVALSLELHSAVLKAQAPVQQRRQQQFAAAAALVYFSEF
jgi:CHASE3 domain sensor protein